MALPLLNDAAAAALVGLVIKEGFSMVKWIKSRRNGNGKDTVKGLLEDIRSQGRLTLQKVGGIEAEQGEMKVTLATVQAQMGSFKESCTKNEARIDQLDERVFAHIRDGG